MKTITRGKNHLIKQVYSELNMMSKKPNISQICCFLIEFLNIASMFTLFRIETRSLSFLNNTLTCFRQFLRIHTRYQSESNSGLNSFVKNNSRQTKIWYLFLKTCLHSLSLPLSLPQQPFHGKGNWLRKVELEGSDQNSIFLNFENKIPYWRNT